MYGSVCTWAGVLQLNMIQTAQKWDMALEGFKQIGAFYMPSQSSLLWKHWVCTMAIDNCRPMLADQVWFTFMNMRQDWNRRSVPCKDMPWMRKKLSTRACIPTGPQLVHHPHYLKDCSSIPWTSACLTGVHRRWSFPEGAPNSFRRRGEHLWRGTWRPGGSTHSMQANRRQRDEARAYRVPSSRALTSPKLFVSTANISV